jgi:hypothetical protein
MPDLITAKITKIDQQKVGTNNDRFIRVYFESVPGRKWFKTDLCTDFRNYRGWKFFLVRGNVLGDLRLKNDTTIDADSRPRFVRHEPPPPLATQMPLL